MATLEEILKYNEENDFYPVDAVTAYYENGHYTNEQDESEFLTSFSDAYRGCYDDLEEYARELLEDTGDLLAIPENLRYYFDYASFGRDLEYGGDIWTSQVGFAETYVFSSY